MKAFVHTPEGEYVVEANFFLVDNKGDVVTLYGHDQLIGGQPSQPRRPLATVKLTDGTFILYGDTQPQKREREVLVR
jgi:hypothetical protein